MDIDDATPEQANEILEEMLGAPAFETMVLNGLQEVFERVVTLENVIMDIITIVSENTHSPSVMADDLKSLLTPINDGEPEEGT